MVVNNTHAVKAKNKYVSNSANTKYSVCKQDCIYVAKPKANTDILSLSSKSYVGKTHEIPDSVKKSPKANLEYWYFKNIPGTYYAEDNKGINKKGARQVDIALASYSKNVAERMQTGGFCYTGVKYALWDSGVIDDYGDMPKGNASDSVAYFNKHPDKFQKVNVSKDKLSSLPAGYIIVYSKEGLAGHIAITNGNGQEMSDCTDNMKWLDKYPDGKFSVYKLTDNCKYNEQTKKLEFKR